MDKIALYTQANCRQSDKIKQWLNSRNIRYLDKDITYDVLQKREMIERSGGRAVTPQMFMGNQRISSFEELQRILSAAAESAA
jgi:glutaredoxin